MKKNTILAIALCFAALGANAEHSMLGAFEDPDNAERQKETYRLALSEHNKSGGQKIGIKIQLAGNYRVIASESCRVIAAALSCSTAEQCQALQHARSAGCTKAPVKGKKRKVIQPRPAASISSAKPDTRSHDPRSYEAGHDFYEWEN
jgi:hypothetical protein